MNKDAFAEGLGTIISVEDFDHDGYEGYKVKTDKTIVQVAISSFQSCCEQFGYFSTEDSFDDFIGSVLLSVELTDTSLKNKIVECPYNVEEDDVQFVSFNTNNGTFQLAVYNYHNGYYGHTVFVKIGDTIVEEYSL